MIAYRFLLALTLTVGVTGCRPKQKPSEEVVAVLPTEEVKDDSLSETWQQVLDKLPEQMRSSATEIAKQGPKKQLPRNLLQQLEKHPDKVPYFSGTWLPLEHRSLYDDLLVRYQFLAPKKPDKAKRLIIALADSEATWLKDLDNLGSFVIAIPTRPMMSYQMISEGDFWNIWNEVETVYPELVGLPTYLATDAQGADGALFLANNYRSQFQGLAYSGGQLGLELPNLDHFSLIHYAKEKELPPAQQSLFGGARLIERLRARGNLSASTIQGNISDALKLLFKSAPQKAWSFTFSDYAYAQCSDAIRVLSKLNEEEPASLRVNEDGSTLILDTINVSSLELSPAAEFTAIRWNGRTITFQKNTKLLILGEDHLPTNVRRKVENPSGLLNFFRHEPVMVIYQSAGNNSEYLDFAENIAHSLSRLSLLGLPTSNVQLPVVRLEDYRPRELPPHRAIMIGEVERLQKIVETTPGYFPLQAEGSRLLLRGKPHFTSTVPLDKIAFALSYPPERSSPLKLAFILSAKDEEGLQTLSENYLNALSLYSLDDVRVFADQGRGYRYLTKAKWDSYWGFTSIQQDAYAIPPTKPLAWREMVQELMIANSGSDKLAVGSLIREHRSPPVKLSNQEVSAYVQKRHLALVELTAKTAPLIEQLVGELKQDDLVGISLPLDTAEFNDQHVVIDARHLSNLTLEDRLALNIRLLPFNTQELVQQRLAEDVRSVGLELVERSQ